MSKIIGIVMTPITLVVMTYILARLALSDWRGGHYDPKISKAELCDLAF